MADYSKNSGLRSVKYAVQGIRFALGERNFRFQLFCCLLVGVAGLVCHISSSEWAVVIIACCLVLTAEIFNTALEQLVNMVSPERHPVAGKIKDLSAAAVLVIAAGAALTGLIIFIPRIAALFC